MEGHVEEDAKELQYVVQCKGLADVLHVVRLDIPKPNEIRYFQYNVANSVILGWTFA